jgi:hypothetical protein
LKQIVPFEARFVFLVQHSGNPFRAIERAEEAAPISRHKPGAGQTRIPKTHARPTEESRPPGASRSEMDAKAISKAKLPSRHVTVGPARAPHRSFLYAMGL